MIDDLDLNDDGPSLARLFKLKKLKDGRQWVTDGIVGFDPSMALKLVAILKEISCVNATMSVHNGTLWVEDGTSYDLEQVLNKVSKK